jgi:pyrimidine-nucleoside phosphorylase
MRALDLILKKRDGGELNRDEIDFLIRSYVEEKIPEYQIAAWLMAVFFRGMTPEETGSLTDCMIRSGDVIDLSGLPGPLVDKHSTGGVGDKVSLILAPLAAACGLQVPMMSGRALGHTGGTLDKLDSIPGYRTDLAPDEFRTTIESCGFAMTGQSKEIVPADRLLYSLRDVTGTVESIPLITASILSKKFAEGANAFVFDVKYGSGAFMKTTEEAKKLADSLIKTGTALDKKIVAVLSNMEQPLGSMVGNFLEVEESLHSLQGKGPEDLMKVVYRLTAWMLIAGGIAQDLEGAERLCRKKIDDGSAYDVFLKNVELQGGNPEKMLDGIGRRRAGISREMKADTAGWIERLDAFKIGMASVYLGAGRSTSEDDVLPDVGIELLKKQGDRVEKGDVLCVFYGESDTAVEQAADLAQEAYHLKEKEVQASPMVFEEMADL